MKTTFFTCFIVRTGQSNDDVGGARGTIFQGMRPAAGPKTSDFVTEMFGGTTVERLEPEKLIVETGDELKNMHRNVSLASATGGK